MTTTEIKLGTVVEYTCDETFGADAGSVLVGDVTAVGKSYADVKWRDSGRTERIRYRDRRQMTGMVFKSDSEA